MIIYFILHDHPDWGVKMSANISTKEITKLCVKKIGWLQSKFFFPTWKVVPGAYSDQRETPGTPRKGAFSDWKRPKEGERVTRRHFHERVGEGPWREKIFGTSGYKIRRFVSEIWPFEVGICVRADQLGTDIQGAKQQCAGDRTWVL